MLTFINFIKLSESILSESYKFLRESDISSDDIGSWDERNGKDNDKEYFWITKAGIKTIVTKDGTVADGPNKGKSFPSVIKDEIKSREEEYQSKKLEKPDPEWSCKTIDDAKNTIKQYHLDEIFDDVTDSNLEDLIMFSEGDKETIEETYYNYVDNGTPVYQTTQEDEKNRMLLQIVYEKKYGKLKGSARYPKGIETTTAFHGNLEAKGEQYSIAKPKNVKYNNTDFDSMSSSFNENTAIQPSLSCHLNCRISDDLSEEEKKAVQSYTREFCGNINSKLLMGRELSDTQKSIVENLDSVLKKSRSKEDMVCYRGMHLSDGDFNANFKEIGKRTSCNAFQSVSTSFDIAESFNGSDYGLFEYHIPKGTPCASFMQGSDFHGEEEILLARNLVTKTIGYKEINGRKVTVVELLPPEK